MKNFFKQLGKAICYFLLYIGVQNIIAFVYMMVYIVKETTRKAGEAAAAADLGLAASEFEPNVGEMLFGAIEYVMLHQNSLLIVSGIVTILFLILFFAIRKKNVVKEVCVKKTQGKNVLLAIGLGLSCMLVINFGLSLLPESWLMAYSQQSNMLVEGSTLAIIISTMVMAPLIEELIFRGLMLSRLRKAMPDWAAVLICALMFGLAHGQILWMTYTFALGVVMGLVAVKSESIIPSLVLHMVFNICGVIIPTLLAEVVTLELCIVMLVIGVLITGALLITLLKTDTAKNDTLQTA